MKNKTHISVFFLGGSEIEKNSFMALPGDGGHSGIMPQKLYPNLERVVRNFIVKFKEGMINSWILLIA